jgi:hypothetical protein
MSEHEPTTGLPEEYRELLRNDEANRRERARLLKRGWRPRDEAWQVLEEWNNHNEDDT